MAITKNDMFDFLIDIVPRDEIQLKTKAQKVRGLCNLVEGGRRGSNAVACLGRRWESPTPAARYAPRLHPTGHCPDLCHNGSRGRERGRRKLSCFSQYPTGAGLCETTFPPYRIRSSCVLQQLQLIQQLAQLQQAQQEQQQQQQEEVSQTLLINDIG